jgi:thymidylate synthase ThyX
MPYELKRATQTDIFQLDQEVQDPEDKAMLQALYSRSADSARTHAAKVREKGSGKFMSSFYVGYGHASIGDCGSTTLFVEGGSMLDAKAIQDWPLYSGQETSTRYIDMSKQPLHDPVGTDASAAILRRWMDFYLGSLESVTAHVRATYPPTAQDQADEKSQTQYDKATKARAFDILRSFLPAAVSTNVAWHTNLRQAADKLKWMRHHPLAEIRTNAEHMLRVLREPYADSFSHKIYPESEAWRQAAATHYTYFTADAWPERVSITSHLDAAELSQYAGLLASRPPKTELPSFLAEAGQVRFEFQLDFGSFRDLQRHRNGVCRMPLLTTHFGFHPWYLENLPPETRAHAEALIAEQVAAISALDAPETVKQYYVAMGFRVPCRLTQGLPATIYLIELRSGKTVHPTLRKVAQEMAIALRPLLPPFATLHADLDADDWDVRRGSHDIVKKG